MSGKAIVAVIVAVVLIGGAVALSWPQPGYKLYLEQNVSSDEPLKSRVVQIVRLASSRTDRFADHRARLSLSVDPQKMDNPTPGETYGGAVKLGDLVGVSLGVKYDNEYVSFKADFKADNYLAVFQSEVAERFGIKRYYLVVQSFNVWPQKPAEPATEVRQLLAYLYPLKLRPSEIPYRSGANDDELADQLARTMLESAVISTDCAKVLCLEDLSASLVSLDRTTAGFEVLLRGRSHPTCSGLADEEACFMKSEQEFLSALQADPKNHHAHLGLGLIEISRAKALSNRASAYTVGEHLIGGFDHLAQATSANKFIGALVESEPWRKLLETSREFQGLDLSPEFLRTADAYRLARRAMLEGRYDEVVRLVSQLKAVPAWLKGHVAALKTQAELERTSDRASALQALEAFERDRDIVDRAVWTAIYGRAAAEWAQGDQVWADKAVRALREAVNAAHDRPSTLDAMATEGAGYAQLGRKDEALKIADDVEANLKTDTQDGKKYRSVWLSLGFLLAYAGEFERAAADFSKAISYDRAYLPMIESDRRLSPFRDDWKGYRDWRLRVLQ